MPTHLNPNFLWNHALDNRFELAGLLRAGDGGLIADLLSYRLKAAVATLCRPARVLSLGCGAGYGVAALLWGSPHACCAAVDRGGELFDHARLTLPAHYPDADLRFVEADTKQDPTPWLRPLLVEGAFDLVFLDGEQSRVVCGNNLQTAYWAVHSGGFILIDGYDACAGVRAAAHDFLFSASLPHIYCRTARGDLLINVHKK